MMDYDDLDDIFGRMDESDRSNSEDEEDDDDDGKISSKKKKVRDDEAEEDNAADGEEAKEKGGKKKKSVGPKRVAKNPQPKLDQDRISGPRGIPALLDMFKDVKLKGKGHEKADLDLVLKKMEHWAHRLFPQLPFKDCIEKIEKLGAKKGVQTYLKKLRMDMIHSDNQEEARQSDEENIPEEHLNQPEKDAFDDLLAHYSKPASSSHNLTIEQQERMAENKRRAEERRKSRLQNLNNSSISAESFLDPSQNNINKINCSTAKESETEELMDIDAMLADIP